MKLNLIDCGVLKNFHAMMETMPVNQHYVMVSGQKTRARQISILAYLSETLKVHKTEVVKTERSFLLKQQLKFFFLSILIVNYSIG